METHGASPFLLLCPAFCCCGCVLEDIMRCQCLPHPPTHNTHTRRLGRCTPITMANSARRAAKKDFFLPKTGRAAGRVLSRRFRRCVLPHCHKHLTPRKRQGARRPAGRRKHLPLHPIPLRHERLLKDWRHAVSGAGDGGGGREREREVISVAEDWMEGDEGARPIGRHGVKGGGAEGQAFGFRRLDVPGWPPF